MGRWVCGNPSSLPDLWSFYPGAPCLLRRSKEDFFSVLLLFSPPKMSCLFPSHTCTALKMSLHCGHQRYTLPHTSQSPVLHRHNQASLQNGTQLWYHLLGDYIRAIGKTICPQRLDSPANLRHQLQSISYAPDELGYITFPLSLPMFCYLLEQSQNPGK